MLSVIICSVNELLLNEIRKNIEATAGVAFELLVWDNKGKDTGLCEVYNKLAKKAKYPILCFCHEDIVFETINWGQTLESLFLSDPSVSLVGIAGSKYKSRMYSGWYSGIDALDYYKIIHEVNKREEIMVNPVHETFPREPVVCIDGVFMVCKKEVWEANPFNEAILKGFHFYDIDFSLRVAQNNKVVVTDQITIRHITQGGDYGNRWVESAFLFHDKMNFLMPFPSDHSFDKRMEWKIAKVWLDRLKGEKISWRNRIRWVTRQRLYKNVILWYAILKFCLYRPFGMDKLHNMVKRIS